MNLVQNNIQFSETNSFSKIATDYIHKDEKLKSFIGDFPSKESVEKQIEKKKNAVVDRYSLHEVLKAQYAGIAVNEAVKQHIDLLLHENVFTICTAHQPCIFTGPLYFIYKISHAIKMAKECRQLFPACHFIPVFYIGSEDNDLEEIGTFFLDQKKLVWNTDQTGACGRMNTQDLQAITHEVLAILNENVADEKWLKELIESAYLTGKSLTEATRILVNGLFEEYGLLVLDADDARLKGRFNSVIEDELFNQRSSKLVSETADELAKNYKIQAAGRDINLFYLKGNIRERIGKNENRWIVNNTAISFTENELREEVKDHPEHFSPNVILRPLYQETILPNIAFIGGGGELAYWLELKKIFDFYQIPYPIVMLRNSFLLVDKSIKQRIDELKINLEDIFLSNEMLYKRIIAEDNNLLALKSKIADIESTFKEIEEIGSDININLGGSAKAHAAKAKRIMDRLTQKFTAHIKRNESDKMQQADKIKQALFPANSLQERHDNFIPYFKKYGIKLIDFLIEIQPGLESEFVILTEE